jgi:hypothetical protein
MDREDSSRRMLVVCQAAVFIGVAMIVAGFVSKATVRPSAVWSKEQAKELTDARNALHDLTYNHEAGPATAKTPSESTDRDAARAAAQARFDRIQADLEQAQTAGHQRGAWLIRIGLAAIVLFGIGYLSAQR